jgi:ubiquinone/menaquinone biosynthesis C-methylase UbiE
MIEIRYDRMETTEASRQAYEAIYTGEGILHRDSFYLWLIELLQPEAGKLLLDISCGQGRLVTLAQARGLAAIGTDFSLAALLRGVQDAPAAGWAVGDGEALPLKSRSVDYVTHIGSLEHYQDPDRGAREICRVLTCWGTSGTFSGRAKSLTTAFSRSSVTQAEGGGRIS